MFGDLEKYILFIPFLYLSFYGVAYICVRRLFP